MLMQRYGGFCGIAVSNSFPCGPTLFYSVDDAINTDGNNATIDKSIWLNRHRILLTRAFLLGMLVIMVADRPTVAQNPSDTGPYSSDARISLPSSGVAPVGFRIEMMHPRLMQFGDLPMRVVVVPTAATFQEDRELTFRITFDPKSVTPSGFAANYQFSIKLAAGDSLVDKTFYLPKWFMRGDMRLAVLESGQPLVGYTTTASPRDYDTFANPYNPQYLESIWMDSAVSRFGWIATPGSKPLRSVSQGSELDDIRVMLLSLVPELGTAQDVSITANLPSILKTYGDLAGIDYRTVEELPQQWQGLQQCHVWITKWSTWESIKKNQPNVALAMQQYVRCGGALWIVEAPSMEVAAKDFGVRLKPKKKPEADGSSGSVTSNINPLDQLSASAIAAVGGANNRGLRENLFYPFPDFMVISFAQNDNSPLQRRYALLESLKPQMNPNNPYWRPSTIFLTTNSGKDVVVSDIFPIELGAGVVVCCSHSESAVGGYFQWMRMQELTGTRLSNVVNRGVDPIVGDTRFWNWTIPGVAQPPVYTFIGLLFLFVILVGPLAYRKLTQLGRGYLMFFVAPILAATTTLILFLYGVIADGLGTQARIRQVTWLCEEDGGAVQYWRSTYFAGLRPSDGLAFPASTHVVPYRTSEYNNWYMMNTGDANTQGTITLTDAATRLSSGFFPSRQQRQFVAYRPLEKAGGLQFSLDEDSGLGSMTSRFAYDLREVVVCDAGGAHWYCEELPNGSTQRAVQLDITESAAKLSDMYMRQMPVAPPGIVRGGRGNRTRLDLVSSLGVSRPFLNSPVMNRAATGESQIDWWLRETLQTSSSLPPLMFIAVSDVSEDCIASPGARLVESIHYVVGDLQ